MTISRLDDGTYYGEVRPGVFARIIRENRTRTTTIWVRQLHAVDGSAIGGPRTFTTLTGAKASLTAGATDEV